MKSNSLPRFLLAAALFASAPVFAATEPVITGGLPRNLASGSFSLTVTIKDVSEADKIKGDADAALDPVALFKKRLYVKLPQIDSAPMPVSLEEASVAGSEKKVYVVEDSATVPEPDGDTYTYTFNITITEVEAGILADKAKENQDKLNITVEFYLGDDKVTEKINFPLVQESYVIKDAPNLTSIVGTNRALRINWTINNAVAIKGGTGTKAPSQMRIYVVDRAQTTTASLPGRKFVPSADEDPVDACSFADPGTAGGACVTCPTDVYLDLAAIKANPPAGFSFDSEPNTAGFTQIAGLDNEKQYLVFLQYEPDGLAPSQCLAGQPSPDLSLTEANGEDDAEIVDFRCFIATAAYGSPLHKDLVVFRHFRDDVLMQHAAGRAAVSVYYKWSPGVARHLAAHPRLKAFVRSGLEVVAEVLR